MKRKKKESVAENFLMYFSSVVAVFLIISISFGAFALPIDSSLNSIGLSSSLFVILALSMFLYMTLRIRSARRGAGK